jgi:hypothetical protein
VAQLKEMMRDQLDYSMESTDGPNLVAEAVAALGIRGTCAMVGGAKMTASVTVNHPDVLLKEASCQVLAANSPHAARPSSRWPLNMSF